ncbi:MAG: calycin-like domain-containing protein [Treponemataceae bacterium]|nr:calycin-like domain-containing protein [Treponemataceae bacterium]
MKKIAYFATLVLLAATIFSCAEPEITTDSDTSVSGISRAWYTDSSTFKGTFTYTLNGIVADGSTYDNTTPKVKIIRTDNNTVTIQTPKFAYGNDKIASFSISNVAVTFASGIFYLDGGSFKTTATKGNDSDTWIITGKSVHGEYNAYDNTFTLKFVYKTDEMDSYMTENFTRNTSSSSSSSSSSSESSSSESSSSESSSSESSSSESSSSESSSSESSSSESSSSESSSSESSSSESSSSESSTSESSSSESSSSESSSSESSSSESSSSESSSSTVVEEEEEEDYVLTIADFAVGYYSGSYSAKVLTKSVSDDYTHTITKTADAYVTLSMPRMEYSSSMIIPAWEFQNVKVSTSDYSTFTLTNTVSSVTVYNDDGEEKTIKISSFSGSISNGTLSITMSFKYGSMPFSMTYTFN